MSRILTAHFTTDEFSCPCCGLEPSFDDYLPLAKALEKVRSDLGSPIFISSGRRCQSHNDSLPDSVPNSQHVIGVAADISVNDVLPTVLAMIAYSVGFRSIGIGSDYIHLDMRNFGLASTFSNIWHY